MYCINPNCPDPQRSAEANQCLACGAPLLFHGYQAIALIEKTQHSEIFEVVAENNDGGTIRRIMKVIQAETSDRKRIELFEREYAVLSWLNHPNIPRVDLDDFFRVSVPNGHEMLCLVMQKMEGETLEQWITQNGPISEKMALEWLRQLVAPEIEQDPESLPGVLAYLHQNHIVHRDLKPSNLILQPSGKLALIDFGGVCELTNTTQAEIAANRRSITVITSPGYSAPEQINAQVLLASDFYALGRTWVRLLTAQLPIDLIDPQTNQLQWHRHAPQISRPFARWLDTLMSPTPDRRPPTTIAIYETLTYQLPQQIRVSRILNSWAFKVTATGVSVAIVIGAGIIFNSWRSDEALRRGLQNLQAEQYQTARRELEVAVRLNDRSSDARTNLGLACYYLGDDPCAIEQYRRAIELMPDNWQAHYNLGSLYDRQGKVDLAIDHYTKATNGSNDLKALAINNIARLKNRQRQYAEAEALVQSVFDLTQTNSTLASLYKNLGWALFGLKQYSEAQVALEKALPLDPTRIDTYCLLAFVKQAQNFDAEAERSACKFSVSRLPLPEVKEWQQQLDKQKG